MDATVPDPRDSHRQSRFRESAGSELQDLPPSSFSSRRPHHPEYIHLEEGAGLGHRPSTRARTGLGIEDGTTSPVSPQSPQIQPLRGDGGYAGAETNTRSARLVHGSPNEGFESATTTPGTGQPFLSPESTYGFQQQHTEYRGHRGIDSSTAYRGQYHSINPSPEYQGGGYGGIDSSIRKGPGHMHHQPSVATQNSDHLYDPFLLRNQPPTPAKFASEPSRGQRTHEMPPTYDGGNNGGDNGGDYFDPSTECHSRGPFVQAATKGLSIVTYLLAIFSTLLSGLFFGVAVTGPRYKDIHENGRMRITDAILVTSVLAKIVELTFVTAFITFVGQALSRRAFELGGRGMNLAEMNMRSWVTQPGTMITHWHTVRYAGFTGLGALSLLATILATLYTPAATALVQPQLKMSNWEPRALQSIVKTQWGDQNHVATQCNTPQVNDEGDPGNPIQNIKFQNSPGIRMAHMSCLQVEYAAQSYHNYIRYFNSWASPPEDQPWTEKMSERPRGIAIWEEKVAVNGTWINEEEVAVSSAQIDRTVHKVQLAMPHVGVMQAAMNAANDIRQPEDLDGQGIYKIRASVPSPVIHVTCAHLTKQDMVPLVYEEWPGGNKTKKTEYIENWAATGWGAIPELNSTAAHGNATIMDALFGWAGNGTVRFSPENGAANADDAAQARPVFPFLPKPANTILNHTSAYGRPYIYLLGTVPRPVPNVTDEDTYLLCSLKTSLTGVCSTHYSADGPNQGRMQAECENDNDSLRFDKKYPQNATFVEKTNLDWIYMAQEWGNAINLNDGRQGGGSNSRILTHLALPVRQLNASMPSPSEALAVLAGSTLLLGMQDSQLTGPESFVYTDDQLAAGPAFEDFDAEFQSQVYTSGIHSDATRGFMVVLFGVVLFNLIILFYFIYHMDFVTDYTEPPNMFAITLNSPPSRTFAGSCGSGPGKQQYDIGWRLAHDESARTDHIYLVPGNQNVHRVSWRPRKPNNQHKPLPPHMTPQFTPPTPKSTFTDNYEKFSKQRSLL